MIILSFLGLGQYDKNTNEYSYKETTYFYKDEKGKETTIKTKFIQTLWNKHFTDTPIYLVTTEKALNLNSDFLKKEKLEYSEVIVPESKNEEDLWEIFDIISDAIPEGEKVVIDVTHGFRSFPLIVLSCCIYLRVVKNLKIEKVLYGAFESRSDDNITPIIDLTTFVNIIDWSYASREFIDKGDPRAFQDLLNKVQKDSHVFKKAHEIQKLSTLGSLLGDVYNSLSLVNIPNAFKYLKLLPGTVDKITNDLKDKSAKPFGMILKEVSDRFENFTDSEIEIFNDKGIKAQIEIIDWYINTQQYQQAVTLMRELFITFTCMRLEKRVIQERYDVENRLNEMRYNPSGDVGRSVSDEIDLYKRIGDLRNEINHAGMRENLSLPSTQIKNIKDYFSELKSYINSLAP